MPLKIVKATVKSRCDQCGSVTDVKRIRTLTADGMVLFSKLCKKCARLANMNGG